jgi:hypothetical protein
MQKQILVLSDLHVGSSYGLLPPEFLDTQGNIHQQNIGQAYLWECFQKMLNRVANRPISTVVINGDVLDGAQKKSNGAPLTLHRLADQREAAVSVLQYVKDKFPTANWYFVTGTPYHEEASEVAQLAYVLTGEKTDVRQTLTLKVGECIIRFHHEIAYSSGFAKGAGLEKEIIAGLLAAADHGWRDADCEIRSHCHYFRYLGRRNKLCIVSPCWQLRSDFMGRRSPVANVPDIGAVVLHVNDELKKHGVCPVGFSELLYRHPEPEVTELDDEKEVVLGA